MSKAPTRLLEQGRVTIPAEVRRDLELEKGDYVMALTELSETAP